MSQRCYLAGPMSGIPKFNFPLFHEVAYALREQGWVVYNPAEHDLETWPDLEAEPGFATGDASQCPGFDLHVAMRWDFGRILEADAIVMLPYWAESVGAMTERLVAEKSGRQILIARRDPLSEPAWIVAPDPVQARMYAALGYEYQGERRDVLNAQGEPVDAPVSPDPTPLGRRGQFQDVDVTSYDYRARVRRDLP